MEDLNKENSELSNLAKYAIKYLGAELIGVEKLPEKRPPFPSLTGVDGTSDSFKINKDKYPNIVAAGIDTLELNFGVTEYRQPDVFKQLDDAKAEALSAGYKGRKGIATKLFGQDFMVQARGSKGGYEYLLKNGDIDLQMMPEAKGGKPSPEMRVVFRSEFLWGKGEVKAYNQVIEFLNQLALLEYCRVSRADLCVDKVMPLPEINRKTQVVSPIRAKDLYYGGDFQIGQLETGFTFGRGGIAFRFYDKAYEILIKGHGHMIPLWLANGRDESIPVCRLELQLRRDGLRRFDRNMDFATFQKSKADIWAYGTDKFLRIVDPDSATRKARAKVTDYWQEYQDCSSLFGERLGVLPHKQLTTDWHPLVTQAAGCMASAWARLAVNVGDQKATMILEKQWGQKIPLIVIEAGLLLKARFAHMS